MRRKVENTHTIDQYGLRYHSNSILDSIVCCWYNIHEVVNSSNGTGVIENTHANTLMDGL